MNPKAFRMSRPGRVRCFSSAVVNGLLRPSPSNAVSPLIGGISNEGVWTRRLDTDQATSDTPQGKRTLHLLGKGIVAAGVEDDEAQLGCGFLGKQESGERHRLIVNIEIA